MGKSRTVCPRCDSDDVIGDGVEWLDADEVRIGGLCNDCGRTWTIVMQPPHAVNEDPIRGEGMIIDNNGANPNHGCLEGKSCPSCGGFGPFRIDIIGKVTLMDDGYDWSGAEVEEPAMGGTWYCFHCGHEADADAFEEAHRFCVQGLCGSPAKHEDGAGRRLCRAHYLEVLWDRFAASAGQDGAAHEAAWQALRDEVGAVRR